MSQRFRGEWSVNERRSPRNHGELSCNFFQLGSGAAGVPSLQSPSQTVAMCDSGWLHARAGLPHVCNPSKALPARGAFPATTAHVAFARHGASSGPPLGQPPDVSRRRPLSPVGFTQPDARSAFTENAPCPRGSALLWRLRRGVEEIRNCRTIHGKYLAIRAPAWLL